MATKYGLVGPTIRNIKWFDSPEALAVVWHDFPGAKLRLLVDGKVTHGSAEQTAPVYRALLSEETPHTPRPDFDPRIDYPERYSDGPY